MLRRLLQSCASGLLKFDQVLLTEAATCKVIHQLETRPPFLFFASALHCHSIQATSVPTPGWLNNLFVCSERTPGLVFWRPSTPGQRHRITIDYDALGVYTGPPHELLSKRIKNSGGRNAHGRVTVRGRGGGVKKVVRDVDFRRPVDGVSGVVQRLEYDPNRTGFLALVSYQKDGQAPQLKYHLAPANMKAGDTFTSGSEGPIVPGSTLPLRSIPPGVPIYNLEFFPGKHGQIARAASTCAIIQAKHEKDAIVKLPSGELRLFNLDCRATVGTVSNHLQKMINLGKAGANRARGRRPKVRGIAMNPIDHPHGGRTNGGRPSCTPWGVYCKGKRTRRRNKWTNRFILVRKGGQPIDMFANAKKTNRKPVRGGGQTKRLQASSTA